MNDTSIPGKRPIRRWNEPCSEPGETMSGTLLREVDVLVVGGSAAGVAAAEAAARAGASVFLAAHRSYLGDDIAGTLALWPQPGEARTAALAEDVLGQGGRTPLQVKRALEQALIARKIAFR